MSKFKFQINDVFFIQGNMIVMVGKILPKDFEVFSQDYKMKLMQGNNVLHCFEIIGNVLPSRRHPGADMTLRGFSTSDDIKELLTNNDLKTLYILGEKREDSAKDDSKHKKEGMTTWQKRFNK
jgi:hypothetical protein